MAGAHTHTHTHTHVYIHFFCTHTHTHTHTHAHAHTHTHKHTHIGSAIIAPLLNPVGALLGARGSEEEAQGADRGGAAPVAAAGR